MASIDPWHGGRWRARWRTPDGRSRSRVFDRKIDAKRFLATIETDKLTGSYVDPAGGRVTFREFAEEWRERQLWRESTAARIESLLRNHLYPALGDLPLAAIRPSHLDLMVKDLAERLAPSTTESVYRLAASIFKGAVRDRMLAHSPCVDVKLPARARAEVVPLTPEEVGELMELVPDHYRALVVLGAGAGLRLGEALGLTVDRVDFLRRTITVDRQLVTPNRGRPYLAPPKTPASVRVVPLPQVVADALAAHLAQYGPGPGGLIFTTGVGNPVRRNSFGETFRRAADNLGVPPGEGFHVLRHHYASLLIRRGCSVKVVQRRLGHATAEETLNTYGHLWPDDDERTIEAVDDVLGEALACRERVTDVSSEA